jgi:hypothetical protein
MSRKLKAFVSLGSIYVCMMSYVLIPMSPALFGTCFFASGLYAYTNLRGW